MLKSILLACLGLIPWLAMAKTEFSVTGNVKDAKGEALSFANVYLYKNTDSTFYKAAAADINGKFLIEDIEANTYFLKVSSMGYTDFSSPVFAINKENPTIAFAEISLKESSNTLDAVQVTARKPFIEQKIDRTVLNVENSVSGSGSTALEVLEKAPGVMIDRQNDQIKIRNKSGIIVMIDGKRNYMSSEDLSRYLANMPSDQIESIEIITNPSSKYEAAGNAGIINIILKKNKNFGTNGTLTLSGGNGFLKNATNDLYRGSSTLTLNHKNEKWNFFGNGSVGRNRWYNSNHFLRSSMIENTVSDLDQFTQRIGGGKFYNLKGGADYYLTSKTTLGIQADYNLWNGQMSSDGLTTIRNASVLTSTTNSESVFDMLNQNISSNLNLRHKDGDKEITFDIEYSGYKNDGDQTIQNRFLDPSGNLKQIQRQQIIQPTDIDIYSAKLDFTLPFKNKLKLEFGAKTSFVQADNNFKFNVFEENAWQNDVGRSNHFKYDELINALYVSSGYEKGKWSFQAGLRGEHTVSDGYSINLNQRNKRDYLNLFPTGFVNYNLSESHSLKYSYSRRIDRPNYGNLNPFVFILDPYLHVYGNPNLRPQFTNSNEFTYTYKGHYSLTGAYSSTTGVINEVIFNGDVPGLAISQMQNIASLKSYSANFSIPVKINKWWDTQNQFNANYNKFEDANLAGGLNRGKLVGYLNTTHVFTLPKNWTAELNFWYSGRGIHGIFDMARPQYGLNPSIQKSFWDKKAKIKFSANDIFLTSFYSGSADNGDFQMKINNRWNARRVALTFTYNFGNQNVKSLNARSVNQDAKNRVGG
jgi:outer membrane receptor protein involved in Fe transport